MKNEASQIQASSGKPKELLLVTGASGLIGTNTIRKLADQYQCVGLDRSGTNHPSPKVENISCDISSPESIKRALERIEYVYGRKIAAVVHLAAYYDFSGEPSTLYEKVTVRGTEHLLKALQDWKVGRFIFSSTNLLYKPTTPGRKIAEDWPLEASWDYPQSKIETEKVIQKQRGSIPVAILRIAGVYNDEGHSIPISHQIQRIYEKKLTSYFYSGDLLHGNAFIHLDDVVDAIIKTVNHRDSLPEEIILNISEEETLSYEAIQQEIGQLIHGKEWETFEIPKPLAKAGAWAQDLFGDPFIKPWMIDRADDHYELDISKAEKYLNWQPRHSLKATLPRIIEKLKANPKAWYQENNLKIPEELEAS